MGHSDPDARPVLGIAAVAAALVFLAYLLATRDPAARAAAEEALREETHAQYTTFCGRFGRSDAPDAQSRCIAGLWALRAWERERHAADTHDGLP